MLATQTTKEDQSHTSAGRDLAWQKTQGKGSSDEQTHYAKLHAGELATPVNSVQAGLGARDSVEALAQQPGMGWVKQLNEDPKLQGKVDWVKVEEAHKQWDYKQQGLTPEGAAIVTLVAAYFAVGPAGAAGNTAGNAAAIGLGEGVPLAGGGAFLTGAGATVSTVVSGAVTAGLSALAGQISVALINNRGDLAATLHELGSSTNVKNLLTAIATGGVLGGLNLNPTGLPTVGGGAQGFMNQLGQNLQAGAARAVIGTAINGGSFEENLKAGLRNAILDTVAAQSAYWIGQIGPQGGQALNSFTAEVAHAIAGCAVGGARGGSGSRDGCAAGAIGVVIGHLAAQYFDPNAIGGSQTVQFASMVSGIAGALTGQDAAGINLAAGAGANAAANNWLQPKERELRRQAESSCASDPAANARACGIVNALNQLDAAREASNDGTLYKGISQGLINLLLAPVTVPVELTMSISDEGWGATAIAILKNVALLPTNIILGLKSGDPEVQGKALVDALATTAGAVAVIKGGLGIGRGTGTAWDSIKATQEVWPGTSVPRSFELEVGGGRVWVAGNATEHISELAAGMAARGASPEAIGLATQAELRSLQAAVETLVKNGGISYGSVVTVGGWELKFAPPRPGVAYPALIHALSRQK